MNSKIFSYKIQGVVLAPLNDHMKVSQSFDRKTVISQLNEMIKKENYKIDERTLSYKIIEDQLYIEGVIIENEQPKSIGFLSGK